jgi:hypothetical protein
MNVRQVVLVLAILAVVVGGASWFLVDFPPGPMRVLPGEATEEAVDAHRGNPGASSPIVRELAGDGGAHDPKSDEGASNELLTLHWLGTVVSGDGVPCGGVRVSAGHVGPPGGDDPSSHVEAVTLADGRIPVNGRALRMGSWLIRVHDPWILRGGDSVAVDIATGFTGARVIVEVPSVAIAGAVVSTMGDAMGDVSVRGPEIMPTTTGVDGKFIAYRAPGTQGTLAVVEFRKAGALAVVRKGIPWGTSNLSVTMKPGHQVVVTVTDASSGQPVEGFDLVLRDDPKAGSIFPGRQQIRGPYPGGQARVVSCLGSRFSVCVDPHDKQLVPPPCQIIDASGHESVNVAFFVNRRRPLKVSVVSAQQGCGLTASVAVALPTDGSVISLLTPLVSAENLSSLLPSDAIRVSQGATNDRGEIELAAPAGAFTLVVKATGYSPAVINDAQQRVDAAGGITVRLGTAATVVGKFAPREALPENAKVLLGNDRGIAVASAGVDGDGSFRVSDVPMGRWSLFLAGDQWFGQTWCLGELEVSRELQECSFDIGRFGRAQVTGTARVGGSLVEQGRVVFIPLGGAVPQVSGMSFRPSGSRVRSETFAHEAPCTGGTFTLGLPGGRYRVRLGVAPGSDGDCRWHELPTLTEIVPGQQVVDLALPLTDLRLRLVTGKDPVAFAGCVLIGGAIELPFSTDADGAANLERIPSGEYLVVVRVGGRTIPIPVLVSPESGARVIDISK